MEQNSKDCLTIDAIHKGFSIEPFVCRFTEEDLSVFSKLSGDFNPLHHDNAYAKSKGFKSRLVHGMLIAARCSYVVGMILPGRCGVYVSQEIFFHAPVYVEEELTVVTSVANVSVATKTAELTIVFKKQDGTLACQAVARVKFFR